MKCQNLKQKKKKILFYKTKKKGRKEKRNPENKVKSVNLICTYQIQTR